MWLSCNAAGAADANNWLVSLGAQVDDDGSAGYGLGIDWGVTNTTWLSMSGGLGRSPADLADVSTRSAAVGLEQRIGPVGFFLGVESWGDPDDLESLDWAGSLYLQGERYRVGFKGERREIDITFTITGPLGNRLQRTADVGADGVGALVSFDVAQRWRVYLDGMRYGYSRDLTVLPRLEVFDFLSSSALTLSNSFIDVEWGAGLDYELGEKVLSLQWRHNRSAVDRSELRSLAASFVWPAAERWDAVVSLGVSDAQDLDGTLFGGVLLLFYGGG